MSKEPIHQIQANSEVQADNVEQTLTTLGSIEPQAKANVAKAVVTPTKLKRKARDLKEITNCSHSELPHYAKGMCKKCYSLGGREARATKCEHPDRMSYARGLCHKCYCNWYNQKFRNQGKMINNQDHPQASIPIGNTPNI